MKSSRLNQPTIACLYLVACSALTSFSFAQQTPVESIKRPPIHTVVSGTYRQQVRVNYSPETGLPLTKVNSIAFDQKPYAATSQGISVFDAGKWSELRTTGSPVSFLTAVGNKLTFVQDGKIQELLTNGKISVVAEVPSHIKPTSLLDLRGTLYVGTNGGLFVVERNSLAPVAAVNQLLKDGAEIRQMAASSGEVAIAAASGLVTYNLSTRQANLMIPRTKTAGWALSDVRGVCFDSNGNLWFACPQGAGQRTSDGWNLFTGHEGLPYNDFTCAAAGPVGDVWFGTQKGAIHFIGSQWEYRQGKRWLADDVVNGIAVAPNGDAWFATPAGVTLIESRPMTLREKSAFLNAEIDKFHRRTPFGYVDGVHLSKSGDKTTGTQRDSDNDGLWTSMYGAGQCFEYAVTKSAESKLRADNAMRAVGFLSEVPQGGKQSPPVGFPARSILPTSGKNPNDYTNAESDQRMQRQDPLWKILTPRWPVSADGKWYWKTDTSSDELDGHYFFYALYNDLVATTDEDKRYVKAVVDRITTHLIDHDFMLIDHDGKPTRWGQFSPSYLNTDKLSDCRGLNSISVLSYLVVAEHVTGDPKYRRSYEDLLYKHNYFTNVLTPKHQNGPGSGNQSDDEMAFMCYYNLFQYERDPKLRMQYMRSFSRYFRQEEPEACPLFNLIYAQFYEPIRGGGPSVPISIVQDSLETLQRYPLDRINWGFQNSHRLDVVPLGRHIPQSQGRGHLRNGKVIPIDERFVNQWNGDPWRLDGRGSGNELCDGASFLLPYWLGVYHGLIKDDPSVAQ